MKHTAIPRRVIEALHRHGCVERRSPSWIEEAQSGQLIDYQHAQSALRVK